MKAFLIILAAAFVIIAYLREQSKVDAWRKEVDGLMAGSKDIFATADVSAAQKRAMTPAQLDQLAGDQERALRTATAKCREVIDLLGAKPLGLPLDDEEKAILEKAQKIVKIAEKVWSSSPASASPPSFARTQWQRSDLTVLHGIVQRVTPTAVIVEATPPDYGGLDRMNFGAEGGGANIAKLAIENDRHKYGPVLTLEGGRLHEAEEVPRARVAGDVYLLGCPSKPARGSMINVVVAPYDEENYTMAFQVPPLPSGYWMTHGKGTSLDRRAH
jgi:hypothetical protein